jgi:hypothetical protein
MASHIKELLAKTSARELGSVGSILEFDADTAVIDGFQVFLDYFSSCAV